MEMLKKINKVLQYIRGLIFILLFVVGLSYLAIYIYKYKPVEEVSLIENRNLETFIDIEDTSFFDNSFQDKLEDAFKDQFIYRYEAVKLKKKTDQNIASFLRGAGNQAVQLNPVADSGLYQVGTTNYIILGLIEENEDYKERYLQKAEDINKLQEDYPDINIYVYYPTQVHETAFFDDEEKGIKSYGPMYYQLFSEALKVKHGRLELSSIEDYERYFYQQDHHWNYAGSYQGYLDIMNLIFDGQEEVLKPNEIVTSNDELLWQGTMGSRTGYILDKEPFYYYTFDLKDYKVYENDIDEVPVYNMNNVDEYLSANKSGYYYDILGDNNHYNEHFVTSYPEKESLLIIGDSYASAIEPLLCQHFSDIYFVQPINYRWRINGGKYFDIDKFVAEHDIDNILFMYTAENYFYEDTYDSFNLHREGK